MKRWISFLLCLVLTVCLAPNITAEEATDSYTVQVDALLYRVYADYVEVADVIDEETQYDVYTIEAEVDGKPVTTFAYLALAGFKAKGIVIPDSFTTVESDVFDVYVQEIWLPKSIKTIETFAFGSCDSLRLIHWPENDYDIEVIRNNMLWHDALFPHCYGAYFVTTPNSKVHDLVVRGSYRYLPITEGVEYLTDGVGVYSTDGETATMHAMYYVDIYSEEPNDYFMADTVRDIPITRIKGDIFWGGGLRTLYLGNNVKTIENGAFERSKMYELVANKDVKSLPSPLFADGIEGVVYGYAGSYAEHYCKSHSYRFYPIDTTPFHDVKKSDWYYDSVYFCYMTGLMNGTSETSFAPQSTTTRAMLAQVLYNMSGAPYDPWEYGFEDVKSNDWFARAVNWCRHCELAFGTSETHFSPNLNVTREQVATFLYRYAQACNIPTTSEGDLNKFSDVKRVSTYANEAMRWAVGNGIINGQTPTTLNPQGQATRAEIATMLMRFVVYVNSFAETE